MSHTATTDARTRQIIGRLLRVNFAGEHGAIQIYRVQRMLARWLCPEIAPALHDILAHEEGHRAIFRRMIQERGTSPCHCGVAWAFGGMMLGLITGLFGRRGIMICTDAVERAVDRHLNDQLGFLDLFDPEAAAAIRGIQVEELQHIAFASTGTAASGWLLRASHSFIGTITDGLIWLSTRGDSRRLADFVASAA